MTETCAKGIIALMIDQDIIVPVILSGGTGSRLWPVSRESHPKPFIKLPDGQSLLQKTFSRAHNLPNVAEIITITNKEYYLKSKSEYEASHCQIKQSFLLEPSARNTAPAIVFAALKVFELYGPDAILLILPADHLIDNNAAFNAYCKIAFEIAKDNKIATFGVNPIRAETGYGYIECGAPYLNNPNCYHALHFTEKPNKALANTYLHSEKHLWNSGMFCFKASMLLAQFKQYIPELLDLAKICWEISKRAATKNPTKIYLDENSYQALPNISIDYAIMEKSQEIMVIACDFIWHDIGSWEAYKKIFEPDMDGNTIFGDVIAIDSNNNLIHSESRMVASIGINNLAIIDTPDALLISHRDRTQDVKSVVEVLKHKLHDSYINHRTVYRPWGYYTILDEGPFFKIKRIVVKPHESLSLQRHTKRSEHWVVVEGTALVMNDADTYELHTNESTFVPIGAQHRLSNPHDAYLIIIEVQTGTYLGEDDIVRLEDNYGRIT